MDITALSITLGLITMTTLGIGNSMTKPITSKIGVDHYMLMRNFLIPIILLSVFFMGIFESNINILYLLMAFALAIPGFYGLTYLFKALKITKVGLASPVSSINVVFTVFLTYVFFHVQLSSVQILAIVAIILGIFLIRFDKDAIKNHLTKKDIIGLNYALLSGILMGIFLFLSQIPTRVIGPVLTPFAQELGMFILGFALFKIEGRKIKIPDAKTLLITLVAVLFIVVAIVTLYYGLKNANPAIMFALYSANPIVAVIYGALFFKEKLRLQQYFAIFVVVLGIVALRLFS